MDKKEASKALKIALSDAKLKEDITVFSGYAYSDFAPVYCTVNAVAKLIRYQCIYLNGGIDNLELNNLIDIGRKKFQIIG